MRQKQEAKTLERVQKLAFISNRSFEQSQFLYGLCSGKNAQVKFDTLFELEAKLKFYSVFATPSTKEQVAQVLAVAYPRKEHFSDDKVKGLGEIWKALDMFQGKWSGLMLDESEYPADHIERTWVDKKKEKK